MCEAGEVCENCAGAGVVGIIVLVFIGLFILDMALDFPIWGRISSWINHWLYKLPYPKD